ncbi:MAG: hypothetical protein RL220_444 [Bacteroidota bacterium]
MNDKLQQLAKLRDNTLMEALGMEFTHIENGHVEARMPVDRRTHQPYGVLHGGASAALAETLGSFGSHMLVMEQGGTAYGVELNINHLKSVRHGWVTGVARILQQGKSIHVWDIDIFNEAGDRIAVSRLTVAIKS